MIVKIKGLVMNVEEKTLPTGQKNYEVHLYQAGEKNLAIVKGLPIPPEEMEELELTCKAYAWANDKGLAAISLKVV